VTAVQLVNRHRKAYRKFPTLYANYLPILYMNYQDYERLAETRRIILTEGLFDRAAIIRCKPPAACGCILGLSVSDKLVRFLQHFSDRVFLAFDSDAPGKEGIQYVAKVLTEAGVVSFSLSGWCKDPAQWYEKAGEKKMAADLRDQIEGRL
jgi:DNA primase